MLTLVVVAVAAVAVVVFATVSVAVAVAVVVCMYMNVCVYMCARVRPPAHFLDEEACRWLLLSAPHLGSSLREKAIVRLRAAPPLLDLRIESDWTVLFEPELGTLAQFVNIEDPETLRKSGLLLLQVCVPILERGHRSPQLFELEQHVRVPVRVLCVALCPSASMANIG